MQWYRTIVTGAAVAAGLAVSVAARAQEAAPAPQADDGAPAKRSPAAPSAADIEQAKAHFARGAELVKQGKHAEAAAEFKESYRLSRNPLLLYNIGYVYDELGDKELALFYFRKFLHDAPGDSDNHAYARDRVAALERELEAGEPQPAGTTTPTGSAPPAPTAPSGSSDEPASETAPGANAPAVREFMHQVVDEAPPGMPLDLTAFVPPNSDWQVVLYYRGQGASRFTAVVMKRRYNELVGRIPASVMRGTSVQYYIEVKDRSGAIVARAGRSTSPNVVFIDKAAPPRYYPDLGGPPAPTPTAAAADGAKPARDGYFDVGSARFSRLKWAATGAAGGLLAAALASYFVAADAASTLEAEAFKSNRSTTCSDGGSRPCIEFSDFQRDTQRHGQRYQTVYRVTLTAGVISAGLASYLWYREIRTRPAEQTPAAVTVVPVVGPDVVGGTASIEF